VRPVVPSPAVWRRPRRPRPRLGERALLAAALVLAAGWTVLGLLVERSGHVLGTATPPFVMGWAPRVVPGWALAAAVALGAVVALGPVAARRRPAPAFAAGLFAAALGAGLALNAARTGTRGWDAIFDTGPGGSFEAKNEYLPGLPALSYGRAVFLDRFAETVPAVPVNVAGHPPGLLLTADLLALRTPARFAVLCIGCAAACAPLTYMLARGLAPDERTARVAGLLAAASPGLLLIGVTSADAVYAALGTGAAALLVRRGQAARIAGAGALAVAAFFSWALLAAGAFAALVVLQRDGVRSAVRLALLCAAATFALNGVLALAYGYDPIGTLRATEAVYRRSLAQIRPYWYWLPGSPLAWMVLAGLPLTGAWLIAVRRRVPEAVALAAVVGVAAVLAFTKAETERIWLPFVPLAAVAAARVLPPRAVRPVLAALAAQALLVQLLFETVW
jgi:methylthioxylose transferase